LRIKPWESAMQLHTTNHAAVHPAILPAAVAMRLPLGVPPAGPRMHARSTTPTADLRRVLARGETLFDEGDAADCFFQVVSGALRTSKLLNDGRRQIDAFHLPGDIFGLEAGAEHRFAAEAMGDAVVIGWRRARMAALTGADPAFREQVLDAALRSLERAQNHLLLLGRKSASEKMASFLLDMSARLGGSRFELPMQRGDIADHLGLTIETVSRTLTRFARDGVIALRNASRAVELRNRAALQQLDA